MDVRKPENHILCGTCAYEYDRGLHDRGLVKGIQGRTVLKRADTDDDFDDVCCVCGQISAPDKRFLMDVEDLPSNWCKGEHPQLRAAEGKCDCGTTTAFSIWDFADIEDVEAKCLGEGCELQLKLKWSDGEG